MEHNKKAIQRLFDVGTAPEPEKITPAQKKLIEATAEIALQPATADDACYLHAVLCQVGMPRKRTAGNTFERTNGSVSMFLTAGTIFDGHKRIQQPLPYGPKPRLVMINLTSAALRTNNRVVDVGRSTRAFMERMGVDPQGSEYRSLRTQLGALSVCKMELGWVEGGIVQNLPAVNPIRRFEVWLSKSPDQQTVWPQVVELSQEYFEGIRNHAVPLDERAIAALRGSALALDIYTWLAHRLCRVRQPNGTAIRWEALSGQFGQEYRRLRDFRTEFK